MKSAKHIHLLLILLFSVLILTTACNSEKNTLSQATSEILKLSTVVSTDSSVLYRGISKDASIKEVLALEGSLPKVKDKKGLVYAYRLVDDVSFEIEYYFNDRSQMAMTKPIKRLSAIIVNVEAGNEYTANSIYQELQTYYSQLLQSEPMGTYGQLYWVNKETKARIDLLIHESKQSITLNFSEI